MAEQNKIAEALLELLKNKRRKNMSGDRLIPDRPILSRPPDASASGWEKAAALIGAALSPGSTIASMVLAPPAEESIFEREIIGPDGKAYYPERSEGAVPRFKKVQRKATQTLAKFPTREEYLKGANSAHYSEAAKILGEQVPRAQSRQPGFTGTGYRRSGPEMKITEFSDGSPVGSVNFDELGMVKGAGVLPSHQGQGLGKELYKKAAMMGRNVYDLFQTSQDAAKARYAALQDLAQGKFPQKPQKLENKNKYMAAPSSPSSEARPATDWNRLSYLQELQKLRAAFDAREVTAAGYQRGRELLDSGEYRDVAQSVRQRAESESSNMNMRILDLLDFIPE